MIQKLIILGMMWVAPGLYAQNFQQKTKVILRNNLIAVVDGQLFTENFLPQLERVFNYQAKSDLFNLEIEVFGAHRDPHPQLQRKRIVRTIVDEFGVEKEAAFYYAIGGFYVKGDGVEDLSNQEYLCRVRLDLPTNEVGQLLYRQSLLPQTFFTEYALEYNLMGAYTDTLSTNIQEICYVGYWGMVEKKHLNSYQDVIRHFKQKVGDEVLQDFPELKRDAPALNAEIMRRLMTIDRLIIDDDSRDLDS